MSDELRNLSREMAAIEEFNGNVKDVEKVIENINSPLKALMQAMGQVHIRSCQMALAAPISCMMVWWWAMLVKTEWLNRMD